STLAGYVEGQLIGSAPDAFYYLFVTEDNTSENPVEESYWVEAAEMADSLGVDIISTSLGYLDYDNASYTYSYADLDGQTAFMSRGADIAFTRGMLLVTAAGNDGNHEEPYINVPADAINTLAVGAVDANEQYASFSSIGPSADGRVKPDVMAQGFLATYAGVDGSISMGNGTSFAAPIMAGAVACLWQAAPSKTNAEIMQIVKQSADRYNNPNDQYGYGIPDFSTALAAALALAEAEHNPFVLYPNPTSGVVYLLTTVGDIRLYNALGQEVYKAHAVNSINIEKLPAGFYSYVILSGRTTQSGKLIKQ
ncbi:MAG: T9SS type A sorting domain-containing protein, partial [Sphingobacteriales bacterium]